LVAATASSFAARYGWRMLRGTLDEDRRPCNEFAAWILRE
jgi:hypothetical protein